MRYLVLSDIHANLEALEAALAQVDGRYQQLVCLGDIVGYGPDPNQVTERVRALQPVAIVRGNHDKACCGISDAEDFNAVARLAAQWTREELSPENLDYLRGLAVGPQAVGPLQIVHGSVRDEDEYLFHPREAGENLEAAEVNVTLFGHTHFQGGFVRREDRVDVIRVKFPEGLASGALTLEENTRYMINPGSIGQPRDGDPRAGFAFYEDETRVVEYWRVPYDIEATQEKMKEAGLPTPLISRLALGR
ncbi:MAG: metallophosphoesterase family protein [Terriglobia bacterium]